MKTDVAERKKFLVIWPGRMWPAKDAHEFLNKYAGCVNRDVVHIPEAGDRPYFTGNTLMFTGGKANPTDIPGMMHVEAELLYREGGFPILKDRVGKEAYPPIPFDFLSTAVVKPIQDAVDAAT